MHHCCLKILHQTFTMKKGLSDTTYNKVSWYIHKNIVQSIKNNNNLDLFKSHKPYISRLPSTQQMQSSPDI